MHVTKKDENEFGKAIDRILSESKSSEETDREVVDIITFCEDPRYLNFLGQKPALKLWPMQKIVLKMFYRGTRGNKHVQLTDDELEILRDIAENEDLDYDANYGGFSQVIDKYHRRPTTDDCSDGTIFTHLELVMGRRSSKTMMVSIIASYEAYKLLETPNGDPHTFYNLSPDKPIYIINVAVSEKQALDPLFIEIEARLRHAPYFQDKISPASKKGEIYLLTDHDKKVNLDMVDKGMNLMIDGSVVLMSGHSNSASLRGKAAICVLFDEFAHFLNSSGRNSGDEVYNALTPSVAQFGKDGKVVLLSDPKGKDGMFYRLFEMAQERVVDEAGNVTYPNDHIIAFQLPTWRMSMNPNFSKKALEKKRHEDPVAYITTWAAKFMGSQGVRMWEGQRITDCFHFERSEQVAGSPMYQYFMHLDPATTSHNYSLCLCHQATFSDPQGKTRKRVIVDVMKYWTPSERGPVNLDEVEAEIVRLCSRFRVKSVTFDAFASQQCVQRLIRRGINAKETAFREAFISQIYGELTTLINGGDLILFPHQQLEGEMRNLMYRVSNRGFKRFFDPKSEFRSDDCCDALAGAAWQALNGGGAQALPRTVTVNMGGR